jgi:aarF domain-containing kinase
MRGAALKLGQMLSIQDNNAFPTEIIDIINRVQNSANYMPENQLNKVLTVELGKNWRNLFLEFVDIPFAAASIGQVFYFSLTGPSSSSS